MKIKKAGILALAGFAWGLSMAPVFADVTYIPQSALQASTGYYTDSIGGGLDTPATMTGGGNAANVGGQRNDDGFRGPISLNWTNPLSFFGNSYTQFYANNNGNISFNQGISSYTPTGPQGATQPIISPFFADVDTRNSLSGLMNVRNDPNQLIVTWDRVGYYSSHADRLNSFQLVLRGSDFVVPAGQGRIGFFWNTMGWETGDASGGSGGFGGTPGAVGFGDGSNNGTVLTGSIQNGIAGVVQNHQLWFDINVGGEPVYISAIPEPESYALMGAGLSLLGWVGRRKKLEAS